MTKQQLRTELSQARPRLKLIAPLTYRVCQAFIGANLLVAAILLFVNTAVKNVPNPIVDGIIGLPAWAIIYFLLGVSLAYNLKTNNHKRTRQTLIAGLFVQMLWVIALVLLVFQGYNVFVTMTLWILLAWIKAWTIVHFLPVINWDGRGGEIDDKR